MQEIKFRAWDVICKQMRDWKYVHDHSFSTFLSIHGLYEPQYPLMQYTGLKDKNDVEIYEEDIVRLDSWEPSDMQIRFIEGAFCLANKDGKFVGDIHYIHHAGIKQAEVIGNIYENPDLMGLETQI